MIDFSKINGFSEGQRASFEELLCQLARLEKFPIGSRFRRVEGAGGDGGVEAYWTKPNGRKVGYQAKYFLRAGDIDWGQIDKSVSQAIKTHPELEKYIVGLPCDLTDKTGTKGKGKTGWEHWEEHIKKWTMEAVTQGICDLEFEAWPKSELLGHLSAIGTEGLREFFFSDIPMSLSWFRQKLDESIIALDERYHPEDHVNVRIQNLFSTITRSRNFRNKLDDAIFAIQNSVIRENLIKDLSSQPDSSIISEIKAAYLDLLAIEPDFQLYVDHDWPSEVWIKRIDVLEASSNKLLEWYWDHSRTLADRAPERSDLRRCIDDIEKLHSAVSELGNLLRSKYMTAECRRVAFVRGNAGAGKSHLLAQCADDALKRGQPALLLLGQRFNDAELWTQISNQLGLNGRTSDQLLGALDAAGRANGVRTLLLVDAINEGVGSRFWRSNIGAFIHKIRNYKAVCCVIACRSEYFDAAVPEGVLRELPIFDIRGFESPEEQLDAARVYLDKRGIARPSTPWLAPEFINPLFLRSVCISLERDGRSELPPGLTGTKKILKYYLESMAKNIQRNEGSGVSLTPKLGRAVQDIAAQMLSQKQDFLSLDSCRRALAAHFGSMQPKSELEWLTVFLRYGLLRKDPNPHSSEDVFADEDVIRFSFQRFQDFLMAEKATEEIVDIDSAFEPSGLLGFCIHESQDYIAWEWRGLVDALSTVLPEKLKKELVDCLPGGFDKWWDDWRITEAFVESIKWRDRSAFSDRSLQLLNALDSGGQNPLDVLIQVAISGDHPWNADMLHSNLEQRKLPKRDASWTVWLNNQTADTDSNIGILIEWCLGGQAPHTNPRNQYLAALTLCWVFTASNRPIRDKATKALSNIFSFNNALFSELLKRFAKTDDLYVLERLLAAAYGDCCRIPDPQKLRSYSEAVYVNIFEGGVPPYGILLRDYAQGIIELAAFKNALPLSVNLETCQPPFKSPRPRLSVTEEQLDALAKKAGGERIKDSAASFIGDFAQYEIGSRTRRFLKVPLTRAVPLSARQKLARFRRDIIATSPTKMVAFERLEHNANPYSYGIYLPTFEGKSSRPSEKDIANWQADIAAAERDLLKLLSKEEIRQFETEAVPALCSTNGEKFDVQTFDLAALKRWVAKRAYSYGWTKNRFPNDSGHRGMYSRDRPLIERIGKKYQWLALDELLSRLADNYWLEGEFDDLPQKYQQSVDIGFERDIDPTILEQAENSDLVSSHKNSWALDPIIELPDVDEASLAAWPFECDPGPLLKQMPFRTDDTGKRWLVAYEHQSVTNRYPEDKRADHGLRMREFRFLAAMRVKKRDARAIATAFETKGEIDLHNWPSPEIIDAGFLYESGWRSSWPQEEWRYDNWRIPTGVPYAPLIASYQWERHLDASLPDGYRTWLPIPWLARELRLQPDFTQPGAWKNPDGDTVLRQFRADEGGAIALISADHIDGILGGESTFLTVMIAERETWPGGGNQNAAWRRAEGVCWRDGRGISQLVWKRDTGNGTSAKLVPTD